MKHIIYNSMIIYDHDMFPFDHHVLTSPELGAFSSVVDHAPVLQESQLHSPSFIESCRETLQRGGRCAAAPPGEDEAKFVYRATTHVAAKLEKKRLHAEPRCFWFLRIKDEG